MTHLLPALLVLPAAPPDVEFFETRVRPVLVAQCQSCHGPDKQKGGLRLDGRAAALKGGDTGPAVAPGDPGKSLLVEAVGYAGDTKMPPKGKLADADIEALTAWVKAGAVWPGGDAPAAALAKTFDLAARAAAQWSFRPVRPAEPPAVKQADWPATPPDRFVLAKMEAAGLRPAPEADRRTLARRLTFDLTGLPPEPGDVRAFLADDRPGAYDRLVERLLASPAYGERQARFWLDLVRYAETYGHEFDFDMHEPWRYRDYLVRAFNADVPYDRLLTEHVAGDLVAEPRRDPVGGTDESVTATGFWFMHEAKHSPVDSRADEADRIDNQLDVFGKAFLGLTLGCARCHDHKFDPVSTKDYYALAGYMQSSRYQKAFLDDPAPLRAAVAALRPLREELDRRRVAATAAALRQKVPSAPRPAAGTTAGDAPASLADFARSGYAGWFPAGEAFAGGPTRGGEPAPFGLWPPGVAHSGLVSDRLQGDLRSPTFALTAKKVWFRAAGSRGRARLILDGLQLIRSPIYGGLEIAVNHAGEPRWYAFDVAMWPGRSAYVEFLDEGDGFVAVDRLVLSDARPADPAPPAIDPAEALADWEAGRLPGRPDAAARVAVLNAVLGGPAPDPRAGELARAVAAAEARLPTPRRAMAVCDGTGEDEHVFIRGNHKTPGPRVPRRFLEGLPGSQPPAPATGSGRLDLARRLTDPANPLVARVMVNRLWRQHFGEGLVRSPDDFGAQGEPPTHPELLDWLAGEFVRSGWSIKHMHRLMVCSAAYRQSGRGDPAGAKLDPQNKLLHRTPPRRLEAEAVRDAVLAVSGRLDRRMGGPGVMPHLTPFMVGRGRPDGSGPVDGDGRRALYLQIRRNFLNPMLAAFDAPTPFATIGRRSVSNVPAQALALLNNPLVVGQAARWGRRATAAAADPAGRVAMMYEAAYARPPSVGESAAAVTFVAEQRSAHAGPDAEARAWADLAHVLVNVKEFIFVP